MDPHRLAQQRSLALHRLVAARCAEQPELFERARATFERWVRQNALSSADIAMWRALFDGSRERLVLAMTSDDERGAELRGTSPFAVLLSPKERWQLWKQVT